MKTIGILTGGGDVPGLNAAISAVVYRARDEGIRVIGIKRGWGGLIFMDPKSKKIDPENAMILTDYGIAKTDIRKIDRLGGTMLHTSRVNPLGVKENADLMKYRGISFKEKTDMTPDVLKNLEKLGIDGLIAIGGDDTLSYALHLEKQGVNVIGIPKTMDGDVYGTDYCIGFSTAVSKASHSITELRTCMGSHERFGIIELFGRNSGFTALYTALACNPDRVIIPEVNFNMDKLLNFLEQDRIENPSNYAFVIISEGAKLENAEEVYKKLETDDYGHAKLGGIGELVSDYIEKKSGRKTIYKQMTYDLRSGAPDAKDRIYAKAYGNLAMDAAMKNEYGKLTSIIMGKYTLVPLDIIKNSPRKVDVNKFYNSEKYRPNYNNFEGTGMIL